MLAETVADTDGQTLRILKYNIGNAVSLYCVRSWTSLRANVFAVAADGDGAYFSLTFWTV